MGCGCGKRRTTTNTTGGRVRYEVFVNDETTGRLFTSMLAANTYARSVGGEVRAI
jgi:hypothetical protein